MARCETAKKEMCEEICGGADNPHPDTPIPTLNRTGVMVVMLGEGDVTVERMDMMAEGEGVIGGG